MTRRGLFAAGGFLLSAACASRHATGFPGYALVAAAGDHAIAVVNLENFQLAHTIALGAAPSQVIADAQRAYVLTPDKGTVHFIDTQRLERSGSFRLGDEVSAVRFTPDGKRLIGISEKSRELIVADPAARIVLQRIRLRGEPLDFDLQIHSESKALFAAVSLGTSGIVEAIDLTGGGRRQVQLSGPLGNIRFRSDGQLLMAAKYDDQTIVVLDTQSLQTICELPVAMRPENLCFSFDQGQLFVSGSGMDGIAIVFPFRTLEVEQTVLAGRAPGPMACSGNPQYLFVTSRAGSEISILSVETRKVIAVTQAGSAPRHISFTPDNQYALVLDEVSGDMAVIRIPSIKGNNYKSGAALFTMVPVGDTPVDAAIIRRRA